MLCPSVGLGRSSGKAPSELPGPSRVQGRCVIPCAGDTPRCRPRRAWLSEGGMFSQKRCPRCAPIIPRHDRLGGGVGLFGTRTNAVGLQTCPVSTCTNAVGLRTCPIGICTCTVGLRTCPVGTCTNAVGLCTDRPGLRLFRPPTSSPRLRRNARLNGLQAYWATGLGAPAEAPAVRGAARCRSRAAWACWPLGAFGPGWLGRQEADQLVW